MGYNPQTAKEQPTLPADQIMDGAIVNIKDGKVEQFITNLEKWQGDIKSPAIELAIEVMHKGNSYRFSQLFTYSQEGETTVYNPKSNLGKFKKKYGELPRSGLSVKCLTNREGFLRLKID